MIKLITKKIKLFLLIISGILLLANCNKEAIVAENTDYFGIKYDPGNGIFPVGTVQSGDDNFYIFGNFTNKANGSQDAFVMKVDENLKIIWNKTFGGNKNDEFTSMALDDNGNLLAVGTSNSFGSSVDSNYTFSNSRFYMVYLDKDGNTIWEKTHQANNGSEISNQNNAASKVFYLKNNNTFGITGTTKNFRNKINNDSNYSKDVFAFGIDKQANIKWQKRFYDTVSVANTKNEFDESCYDAALSDDGNIILLMTHYYYPYTNLTLIKISTTDLGYSENNYIWKGPEIWDITVPFQGFETGTPGMELLSGNKILIYDNMSSKICLTDDFGKIINYNFFGNDIDVYNFNKDGKNTILNSSMGWYLINPDGTILHKVISTENIGSVLMLNSKKEFIAVGGGSTGGIAMRKFDYNGKVLIK
jgi:hypothetical protein